MILFFYLNIIVFILFNKKYTVFTYFYNVSVVVAIILLLVYLYDVVIVYFIKYYNIYSLIILVLLLLYDYCDDLFLMIF